MRSESFYGALNPSTVYVDCCAARAGYSYGTCWLFLQCVLDQFTVLADFPMGRTEGVGRFGFLRWGPSGDHL